MIVIDTDSASSLIIVKVSAEAVVFTTLTTVAESKVLAEVLAVGTEIRPQSLKFYSSPVSSSCPASKSKAVFATIG